MPSSPEFFSFPNGNSIYETVTLYSLLSMAPGSHQFILFLPTWGILVPPGCESYSSCPFVSGWLHSLSIMSNVCCSMCQFIPFFKAEQYSSILYFVYPFTVDEHLGCFYLLAIVNNAAMDIGVKYLSQSLLSVFWDVYPEWSCWIIW